MVWNVQCFLQGIVLTHHNKADCLKLKFVFSVTTSLVDDLHSTDKNKHHQ
jgi:hypothetical protein